jgi:hypothetical protein
MSEQKKKSNPEEVARAKKLAANILGQLEGVLTVKLRELKPQLQELRLCFKKLGKHDRIESCRTWKQFCSDKLHRTDRDVRKLLAEVKAGKNEETQAEAEQSSAASDATKDTCDASGQNASEECESEEEAAGTEEDGKQNEAGAWEEAKSSAKKKVRHFFNPLDSVQAIEGKMNDLLDGLIPCRKFKVTVVEVIGEGV